MKSLLKFFTVFLIVLSIVSIALSGVSSAQTKVTAVGGGEIHSAALKEDGTVWTWGTNSRGQLGNGTIENSYTPVQVVDTADPTSYLTHVIAIDVGKLYYIGSGGHTLALKDNGTVFAWGFNPYGQLGDGTVVTRSTAVQVIDPADPTGYLTSIKAIAAGAQNSLAVKQDGLVLTWGRNNYGQLGDATTQDRWFPGAVSGLNDGIAVAGGYGHSLAIKQDGTAWAWGNNGNGQLGCGDNSNRLTPVQVFGLTNAIALAAGKYYSAALKGDGTVWTWGENSVGQLGNGTVGFPASSNKPVQVKDPMDQTGYLTGVIAIACGDYHTMALKADGTIFAWGANNSGQLGDGTTINKTLPVQVSGLSSVIAIDCGNGHSLAVKSDGTAWAWGGNWGGQLGDGTTVQRNTPVIISFPLKPERKLLSGRGPYFITPGEEITYAIQFDNILGMTLEDALVIFDLPGDFTYVSSTKDGIYRVERDQVFWKLGDVSPDQTGLLSLKMEVPWGLSAHAKMSVYFDLAARNIPSRVNVDDYLSYTAVEAISEISLTEAEINELLSSDPELKSNYDYALSLGYVFDNVAQQIYLNDGSSSIIFVLIDPEDYGPIFLKKGGDTAFIERYGDNIYSLFDKDGGYSINTDDGSVNPWGTWAETHSDAWYTCISSCVTKTADGWNEYIRNEYKGSTETCTKCQTALKAGKKDPGNCSYCAQHYLDIHKRKKGGLPNGEKISTCFNDCKKPSSWRCAQGDTLRECRLSRVMIGDTFIPGYDEYICQVNNDGAQWIGPDWVPCLGICVNVPEPPHCADPPQVCKEKVSKSQNSPIRSPDLFCVPCFITWLIEVLIGGDPNAKSIDIPGNVIPGQKLTYTIEYENVGEGAAYGVFILDTLDTDLDEGTLQITNGTYTPATRLLSWEIGTIPSKGKGSVSFSVNVKNSLPSGTEITNYADVYFPSVPEITPTNAIVSIVKTIAADPKTVETISGTPVSITLTGRDSGSHTLTYRITTPSLYGTLTGTPPNVSYTSMDEFSGQDEFSYVVNNSLIDSDPAKVRIIVNPNTADTKPPIVNETYPKSGDTDVHVIATPFSTEPPLYAPSITATFSEPIDSATITSSTFTVGGITGTVAYDEESRTASFTPSKALSYSTTYTARLSTAIKDKVGNSMVAEFSWQFTTESLANISVTLPGNVDTIDFGNVAVDTISQGKVATIQNTGPNGLVLGTIVLGGTNAGDFSIAENACAGKTLAQSENCTVKIAFTPTSTGTRNATLSIPSNDPDTPTFTVQLRGTGILSAECSIWSDVIGKYNSYVGGQAEWDDVIACYNQYASL